MISKMNVTLRSLDNKDITPRTGRQRLTGSLILSKTNMNVGGTIWIEYDRVFVTESTPSPGIATFVKEILTNTKKTFEFISEDNRHFRITFNKLKREEEND